MALRVCPECTEPVSEHASSCPHCGFRGVRAAPWVQWPGALVGAGVALLILGAGGGWAMRARLAVSPPRVVAEAAAASSDDGDCDCDCDADSATDDREQSTPASTPTSGPNGLLIEAQDAYVHGDYETAIRIAKHALSSEPARAWRVIGAADCFLHDRAGAREAWGKLGSQERAFLTYVCGRNHVSLP